MIRASVGNLLRQLTKSDDARGGSCNSPSVAILQHQFTELDDALQAPATALQSEICYASLQISIDARGGSCNSPSVVILLHQFTELDDALQAPERFQHDSASPKHRKLLF